MKAIIEGKKYQVRKNSIAYKWFRIPLLVRMLIGAILTVTTAYVFYCELWALMYPNIW